MKPTKPNKDKSKPIDNNLSDTIDRKNTFFENIKKETEKTYDKNHAHMEQTKNNLGLKPKG